MVELSVGLIRTDDHWAIASACWIFAIRKKLVPLAKLDDIEGITERINGGHTGLPEREALFNKAKALILA